MMEPPLGPPLLNHAGAIDMSHAKARPGDQIRYLRELVLNFFACCAGSLDLIFGGNNGRAHGIRHLPKVLYC